MCQRAGRPAGYDSLNRSRLRRAGGAGRPIGRVLLRLAPAEKRMRSVAAGFSPGGDSNAEELLSTTRCEVNARANELGTDLRSVWRRAFRYRAEREATANALRVREGKPVETASRCSDGGWTFDGTTLGFSREIPTTPPGTPMPLVLRVKP